jgi:rhodanese-related sulfurtransferase
MVIIDVREKDEFDAEHILGSIPIPLSNFSKRAPGVLNSLQDREIQIMCRSGKRAGLALQQFQQLGYSDRFQASVFDGGILEWKRMGRPVITRKKFHLPVLRQVQLTIGIGILSSLAMGYFVHSLFFALTAFFGAGLTVAGATGFCGLAELLALAPWNRSLPQTKEELCTVSPTGGACMKS